MTDSEIKVIDEWFDQNEDYKTYHHTAEKDGEDIYSVNLTDVDRLGYYLKGAFIDLLGVPCMLHHDSITFTSADLKRAVTCI